MSAPSRAARSAGDQLRWFSTLEAACLARGLGLPHIDDPKLRRELREMREGKPDPPPLLADFLWKSGELGYDESRDPAAIRAYAAGHGI